MWSGRIYREDRNQTRDRNAAADLATLRRMGLNARNRIPAEGKKLKSLPKRELRAARDEACHRFFQPTRQRRAQRKQPLHRQRQPAGSNTINGNITMASGNGDTVISSDSGLLTLNGNLAPNTTLRQLRVRGNGNGVINGVIANGSTANMPVLKDVGNGTGTFNGADTYSGATTVSAGTLALGNAAALGTGAANQQATKDLASYTIEGTDDLSIWNLVVTEVTGGDATAVRAAIVPPLPTLDSGREWHTFRTEGMVTGDPTDFIRLKVVEAP